MDNILQAGRVSRDKLMDCLLMWFKIWKSYSRGSPSNTNKTEILGKPLPFRVTAMTNVLLQSGVWYLEVDDEHTYGACRKNFLHVSPIQTWGPDATLGYIWQT
jgi:hypothetical protein